MPHPLSVKRGDDFSPHALPPPHPTLAPDQRIVERVLFLIRGSRFDFVLVSRTCLTAISRSCPSSSQFTHAVCPAQKQAANKPATSERSPQPCISHKLPQRTSPQDFPYLWSSNPHLSPRIWVAGVRLLAAWRGTLRLARLHDTQRDQRPRTRETEGMVVRSVRCSSCLFRHTVAQGCAHLRVHFAEPGAVRDVGPGCVRIQ